VERPSTAHPVVHSSLPNSSSVPTSVSANMATTTLRREEPLFEAALNTKYFASAAESEDLHLTIRVISGTRFLGGGQSQRLLHLEFTNPEDLGFLYTLQIAEEDYHDLKQDQSLRTDFAGFADNFIELLTACQNEERFSAVVRQSSARTSRSTFEVVEATQFKNLTHLCLRIQAGNDEDIKAYLAARLALVSDFVTCCPVHARTACRPRSVVFIHT